MPSVDVPVALLGYGTVGAAVHRLLEEQGEEIERATGHRLRVVRALVRDPAKERDFAPAESVLTTDVAGVLDDPSIRIVAEVMGGVDPAGALVLALLESGRSVVTANKQLVARRGAELFAAAAAAGAQLRFEASVCAAIPVIKVLRESLVVTNVPRIVGSSTGRPTSSSPRWTAAARTTRRSPRHSGSATPRRTRRMTSAASTRRRRSRSSRRSRSGRACRSTGSRSRGSSP